MMKRILPLLLALLLLCSCTSAPSGGGSHPDVSSAFVTGAENAVMDIDEHFLYYQSVIDFEEAYPGVAIERFTVSGMGSDWVVSSEKMEIAEQSLSHYEILSFFVSGNDIYYVKKGSERLFAENPVYEMWRYRIPQKEEVKLFSAEDAIAAMDITDREKPTSSTNVDIGPDGENVNSPMEFYGICDERLIFSVGYENHLCSYDVRKEEFTELYVPEENWNMDFGMIYADGCLYFEEFVEDSPTDNRTRIIKYDFSGGEASRFEKNPWNYYPFITGEQIGTMRFDASDPAGISYGMVEEETVFTVPTAAFNKISGAGDQLAMLVNLTESELNTMDVAQGKKEMDHTPSTNSIAARGITLIRDGQFLPLISDRGRVTLRNISTDGTNIYWSLGAGPVYEADEGSTPICYYDGSLQKIVTFQRLGAYWDYQEYWKVSASDNYIVIADKDTFYTVQRSAMDRNRAE